MLNPQVQRVLRKTFGLSRLREGQETVITRVLQGLPTLAIMPTGAGKSLCYQLPAMLLPGRTVVVSPLIALMKDQCDTLNELGVAATQLHSALNSAELAQAEEAVTSGSARIVFTTPERLADATFVDLLRQQPIGLLVVDEAHCVSQWGHDFRPAFLEIGTAWPLLGRPTLLALTATATEAVIEDVAQQFGLGLKDLGVVNTGVYRPNLHYRVEQVVREDEKLSRTLALVRESEGAGLVYAATVKAVVDVHAALLEAGESVTLYHGKLPRAQRHAHQEAFMLGDARIMVATNAFGLGIDKSDTRFVLHHQMPSGLDAYYQESGRAGRDGQDAVCTLLFLHRDKAVQQFFLAGRYPALEDVEALYSALQRDPPQDARWTLAALQAALDRPEKKLQVALRLLRQQKIVAQNRQGELRLLRAGLDTGAMDRLMGAYRAKREHDRAMLEGMVFYGQSGQCRWNVLLSHFGEQAGFNGCGHCDNCVRLALAAAPPDEASSADAQARIESDDQVRKAQQSQEAQPADQATAPARRAAFSQGDWVKVPRYGVGSVAAADADTVTVTFAGGEERCFLAGYVKAVVKRPGRGGLSSSRDAVAG